MLNILRRKKIMKRILWGLAIIIIPAFVLWGAGGLTKRRSLYKYVGIIGDKKIPFDDFAKGVRDTEITLFLNYFNQPDVLRRLRNDRAFLNRLSWENLIMKEHARKNKISVTDDEVINFITSHPLFVRGGAFDDRSYKYILRNSLGLTPRAFEESVRIFLISVKYREEIVKGVTASDEEAREDYKKDFEKAKLYYVVIDKNDYKGGIEPSEEEIAAYYEKNKDRFKEPEKIILQYIAFPHKEAGVREKTLRDLGRAYEGLKKSPPDMENRALKLNLTIEETRPFSRGEIVPEIGGIRDTSAISFKLRPLIDILPLIDENDTGTSYIIRVKEKIPEYVKARDEVRNLIIDSLKDEKALGLARKKAQALYEIGKNGGLSLRKTLKKKAAKDLELNETDFVSRAEYIEGVGESRKLVDEAFKLEIGELSRPIGIRKGLALIEPIEFQFISEEEFEKEKENYKKKALFRKQMKVLGEWFTKAKSDSSLIADLGKI
jgi:hypothetical protein